MEVDLGEEVRNQNVALTEKAKRKLEGRPLDGEEQEGGGSPRKTRLGKDGQPIRGRNRRNSDDIKRDQLVEQILHENRRTYISSLAETPPPLSPFFFPM